jgi:peptidoglycan-associated lipoprotein
MKKRASFGWIVLAIACASLLLLTSCAKKQVGVAEADVKESPAAATQKAPAVSDEAAAEAERKRQAELEALRQKQLEVEAFESVNIYFDFDRSEIKPKAQVTLKNKARWLKDNPGYSVRIEGHCDERGTNEYNLALGERRAKAAADFLVSLGISPNRIRTISYGEERPADPRSNEEAWAKNRRDEFKLFK